MDFLKNFSRARVLVIGDVMLDRYWWGSVNRISPEAPVPVVRLEKTSLAPGGAANVAANIAGLGGKVHLVGCIGQDAEAKHLRQYLNSIDIPVGGLIESENRPTSVKTRVIAHNQQVVRVDQELSGTVDVQDEEKLIDAARSAVTSADAVIVSDYAKGVVTDELLSSVFETGIPVLVDPKGKDYSRYTGASMLTPNRREAAEACNLDEAIPDLVRIAGNRLIQDLGLEALLITEGEHGMTLFERDAEPRSFAAEAREIYDVTGAGDTVIATLGVALAAGLPRANAVELANLAASLVVEQVGTTAITFERLDEALRSRLDNRSELVSVL